MIERVALVSIHTSPLDPPGAGDAGGMNVYVDALARTLSSRGVCVDVFTRSDELRETVVCPGYTVVELPAVGDDLATLVAAFADGIEGWAAERGIRYDVLHSHYWLSGWAGVLLQQHLSVPLAISFHTLGRVKEAARTPAEPRESLVRIAAEVDVVARAECVVASTPADAADLIEHYQTNPERICVSPPGVDHTVFSPGDRRAARERFGLEAGPIVGFVGRIQKLKGLDVAIRAVAAMPGVTLFVVGGPSGPGGDADLAGFRALADEAAPGRVVFHDPVAHADVVDVYRAVDALIVPSRAESFGLVALEALATGIPVVASRVGGLPYVVVDGESGYLVAGHDPTDYAEALGRILFDPETAADLAAGAIKRAEAFSWDGTVDRLLELYRGMVE
ncbi:MAG TPA: glycosyltransferase [Acidimicrobiia bacterium]|nr:glycosyltransferase [Acidimicrobiia bacterium]